MRTKHNLQRHDSSGLLSPTRLSLLNFPESSKVIKDQAFNTWILHSELKFLELNHFLSPISTEFCFLIFFEMCFLKIQGSSVFVASFPFIPRKHALLHFLSH
jgi:hypothetical protein